MSSNAQVRRRAVQAARGESPFDLLLIDAQIVDMATGEIRPADVGIVGEMIASVHPRGSREDAHEVRSLAGGYLSPGLMDTHVHLESSHLPPERYAEIVLTQGTTAVFWDPHELANVLGVAGVRYAVDASRHLPLQVMVAAPSSVPSTPGLEMSGADFAGAEMETMLGWPEVRGVAEVMDMHGVLHGSERMQEIVQAGLNSGKLIEGHARGLSGADLQAYLAAGVTSDHELTSADDALEKLRAGLTVEIRGSHPYLLPDIVNALKSLPHLSSQITVCTDDVPPDMLLEKGGIIALLNLLIEHGLPATDVLRFATLNAAIRLQRGRGGIVLAGRHRLAFAAGTHAHQHFTLRAAAARLGAIHRLARNRLRLCNGALRRHTGQDADQSAIQHFHLHVHYRTSRPSRRPTGAVGSSLISTRSRLRASAPSLAAIASYTALARRMPNATL